jgi:hypothetical protein
MFFLRYASVIRLLQWLILLFPAFSCNRSELVFKQVHSKHSRITFNNRIIENDSINQLDVENIYNGGGVGIGDFNHDGLPDIFFTGNLVACKLYLNRGDFVFQDVTEKAGVSGEGKWCRGVAVADVNGDAWQDLYISVTLRKEPEKRKNLLYIHQGLNKMGIPVFKEQAAEYGLDDDSHTTQAVFFDYDNDGDLDVYLIVNEINDRISPYLFHPAMKDGSNPSTGKLFRNDWNDSLNHPVYTDVSRQAGIQTEGYGHAASIFDINDDGWKDIFVSNDFLTSDLLWINNHDGTFTDRITEYFKHTSANSMGNAVGDINNDGLLDLVTLDMNPEDNYRRKMMLGPNSYQMYQNTERYGYSYQYVRNTLQLNQGPRVGQDDSLGLPVFSEIGYYAGITATDWSWTPMLTDFDNDGYSDLLISNGFPRDITDHDFAMFRNKAYLTATKNQILMQIPEVKLHNYAFRNNADLTFSDVSQAWGMTLPTFSNGSVYVDLDRDGDLDLVMNNINDEASLYRNNTREQNPENSHFLQVQLNGEDQNKTGLGAWIEIHYGQGKKQVWENNPYRGYLSTIEPMAHFGVGRTTELDSVLIRWQNGKKQVLHHVRADQVIRVDIADAARDIPLSRPLLAENALFTEITREVGINYVQQETDFVDFNIQKLLPHKFSEYGPAMAAGDIDGNGLEDLVSGGSAFQSAILFYQQPDGKFLQKALLPKDKVSAKLWDDTGVLLFDADGDHDLDLYISSGGYENEPNSSVYQDHFYVNDGKGIFTDNSNALPQNYGSKFCVRSSDIDKDGDLDLFLAGRIDPWHFPRPVSSYMLRNDSKPGAVRFTDITNESAKDLLSIGMVCDALFTDYDNDGWIDLLLAGEWMPITLLKNENGTFRNITSLSGINNKLGWWNSIAPGDFDNDGDMDYVVGNLGKNSFYQASEKYPVSVYASDFDNNGSYDAFPSIYLSASQQDTAKKEFPVHMRDDAVKQVISMRSRFQNYKSFAKATIDQLFTKEQLEHGLKLKANYLTSSYCRNDGNGKFTLIPLPAAAQISLLNGMVVEDFDRDGYLDVVVSGNDWGTEVSVGRYDALNGLVLKGDGKGRFKALSIAQSGIYIPGNGKGLVTLKSKDDRYLLAAGQNRGPLKVFALNKKVGFVPLLPDDVSAQIIFRNGTKRRLEFYYGSAFLSQSARFILVDDSITGIIISNSSGKARNTVIKPDHINL